MDREPAMESTDAFGRWYVESSYQQFVRGEGAPLYEGSALEDMGSVQLAEWERRGGKVAYTRMADQEIFSLQIVEIPPRGELRPEHHMYDAVMLVLSGQGATTVWQEGERPYTVEWHEGSLLAIPLNAWHQEFNNSGTEPCRYVMGTNMAHMINHFHNIDFIFNNPFVFADRYSANMADFYTDRPRHWNLRLFETNFIPDVREFGVDAWREKGFRTGIARLSMASTSLGLHILDIGEGTYATAHRHDAGAHVVQVGGEGYELLYFEGEAEPRRAPLRPYGVIAPKRHEFHQHFNTGKGPIRQVAFKDHPPRYGYGTPYNPLGAAQTVDPGGIGFTITYDQEDPRIRDEYYRELERNGVELRLPPVSQKGS
ncbi:MAG: Cupin 2 protein [Chloroflexi bacterium]|nr:Cupin 2 protein [Chloroflexota bacterium]